MSAIPSNPDRKRKRSEELGKDRKLEAQGVAQETPARKRQQISPRNCAVEGTARVHLLSCTKEIDLDPAALGGRRNLVWRKFQPR